MWTVDLSCQGTLLNISVSCSWQQEKNVRCQCECIQRDIFYAKMIRYLIFFSFFQKYSLWSEKKCCSLSYLFIFLKDVWRFILWDNPFVLTKIEKFSRWFCIKCVRYSSKVDLIKDWVYKAPDVLWPWKSI